MKKDRNNAILFAALFGFLTVLIKRGEIFYTPTLPFPFGGNFSYFIYYGGLYLLIFLFFGFLAGVLNRYLFSSATLKEKSSGNLSRFPGIGISLLFCTLLFLSPLDHLLFSWLDNSQKSFFYVALVAGAVNVATMAYLLFSGEDAFWSRAVKYFFLGYFTIAFVVAGSGFWSVLVPLRENRRNRSLEIGTFHNRKTPVFKDKNIILIVIDTLRADHLSCYGYERKTSPRIDQFAAEGILFSNAVTVKTKTSPGVASLLTGTYPSKHGIDGCRETLYGEALTIPEVLKKEGYKTCSVVGNGNLGYAFNFDQGFDRVYEMWNMQGKDRTGAVDITDKAVSWLESNKKDKFFLYVHYVDPHGKYIAPDPYKKLFLKDEFYGNYHKKLGIPRKLEINGSSYWGGVHKDSVLQEGSDQQDYDYYISQYDSEIRYCDEHVGRLFDKIKELKLDENTLVILTSDHGEDFGEHDVYFGHGQHAYESCAHIPFIVHYPELPGKRKSDFLVQTIDIFPTILDFLGLERERPIQGNSLMTVLSDPDLKEADYEEFGIVEGNYSGWIETSLRTREWKLIYRPHRLYQNMGFWGNLLSDSAHFIYGRKSTLLNLAALYLPPSVFGDDYGRMYELYNLKNDPHEQEDLQEKKPVLFQSMKKKLHEWISEHPRIFLWDLHLELEPVEKLNKATLKNLKALGYIN